MITVVSPDRSNIEQMKLDSVSDRSYNSVNIDYFEGIYMELDSIDDDLKDINENIKLTENNLNILKYELNLWK